MKICGEFPPFINKNYRVLLFLLVIELDEKEERFEVTITHKIDYNLCAFVKLEKGSHVIVKKISFLKLGVNENDEYSDHTNNLHA